MTILSPRRDAVAGIAGVSQDTPQPTGQLDRRQFLKRAGALGLIVAAPTALQRFWALDRTMIPNDRLLNVPQRFADWVPAKESVTQDWLLWVQGPPANGSPFFEAVAARDIPALIDGGHWKMVFDAAIAGANGPASLIRYVEAELTELSGAPARVASVNGIPRQRRHDQDAPFPGRTA